MSILSLFALSTMLQAPPADTAWGRPVKGVRLGLSVVSKPGGPPVLDSYAENQNERTMIFSAKDFGIQPPVPSFTLNSKSTGAFAIIPPQVYPLVSDHFAWEIQLPPHMPVRIFSTRFFFAATAGTYAIKSSYAPQMRPLQAGKSVPTPITFDSGETSIVIRPEDVHPAWPAGIG